MSKFSVVGDLIEQIVEITSNAYKAKNLPFSAGDKRRMTQELSGLSSDELAMTKEYISRPQPKTPAAATDDANLARAFGNFIVGMGTVLGTGKIVEKLWEAGLIPDPPQGQRILDKKVKGKG